MYDSLAYSGQNYIDRMFQEFGFRVANIRDAKHPSGFSREGKLVQGDAILGRYVLDLIHVEPGCCAIGFKVVYRKKTICDILHIGADSVDIGVERVSRNVRCTLRKKLEQ